MPTRPLRLDAIERVERDRVAVSALLRACPAVDRVRRAGSIDVDVAAERLLPRNRFDVALGAVGPSGVLAGVVNANLIADDGKTFELAVLVAPASRGRGLAATLLRAAAQLLPSSAIASGVIGRDNTCALSLLSDLAPPANLTIDPDSVTFRAMVRPDVRRETQNRCRVWLNSPLANAKILVGVTENTSASPPPS
jgi:GNAT superfamily N-acetyltransferase